MVLHQQRPAGAERGRDAVALLVVDDQIGIVETADPVGEQDAVMGEQGEVGGGGAERGRVGRMAVDDGADIRARAVHAGVQHRLEVEDGVRLLERDHVVGVDLVQGDALALDPDLAVAVRGR